MTETPMTRTIGLRTIAIFEASKGALVLAVGFGLIYLGNQNWQILVENLILKIELGPEHLYSRISRVFLKAISHWSHGQILGLAALAGMYSLLRFIEAFGLWRQKAWAEWLGVISGGIYLPIEIFELIREASVIKFAIFVTNLLVIAYLLHVRFAAPRDEVDQSQ